MGNVTVESLTLEITTNATSAVSGVDSLTASLNKLKTATNTATKSTKKNTTAVNTNKTAWVNLAAKLAIVTTALRAVVKVIANCISESMDYTETLNMFTVSMGEYADEAQAYAEEVSEAIGIDPKDWMNAEATINSIITGFGVASDQAYTMSENLTQLAYDLSSFYNLSVDDAIQKVQSGISGELEPLRRVGYDLSVAALQQTAYNLGIQKSVSAMTQAEKAQLRYYNMMTQVTQVQGDMARTLSSPANQVRVLKAQVTQMARSIGNLLIPALNKLLPYITAIVKVIKYIADSIANFFGIETTTVEWEDDDSLATVTESATEASDAIADAVDEAESLQDALLGIDELNIISEDDDSSSSSDDDDDDDSSEFTIDLPTYDFLEGLVESQTTQIVNMIKKKLALIETIAGAFMLALGVILTLTGHLPLGIALIAIGAATIIAAAVLNWNSMSNKTKQQLMALELIICAFMLALGIIIALAAPEFLPLGIALIAMGAAGLVANLALNWDTMGKKIKSILFIVETIVSAFLLALGAILCLSGATIPIGIALIAAGGIGLISAASQDWDCMKKKLRNVLAIIETIVAGFLIALGVILVLAGVSMAVGIALLAAGALTMITAMKTNWNTLSNKVRTILTKIVSIASKLLLALGVILAACGFIPLGVAAIAAGITGLVTTSGVTFGGIVEKVQTMLGKVGKLFKKFRNGDSIDWTEVGENLGETLKTGLSNKFKNAKSWIKRNVINRLNKAIEDTPLEKPVLELENNFSELWGNAEEWWADVSENGFTVKSLVDLMRNNWKTVTGWIQEKYEGSKLQKAVGVVRDNWKNLTSWIKDKYEGSTLQKAIGLARDGWKTVSAWVKEHIGNAISFGIELIAKGAKKLLELLGLTSSDSSDTTSTTSGSSTSVSVNISGAASGGIFKWNQIPKFASGGSAYGSMFIAGESGAELVGHVNGSTEVLNRFQLAQIMQQSIAQGMAQFTGYWSTMNSQLVTCANGIINAICVCSGNMSEDLVLATSSSYTDYAQTAESMYADSTGSTTTSGDEEAWLTALTTFYSQNVEATMSSIASDVKRQADKSETVTITLNGRELTKQINKQQKANGYSFA